MTMTETRSQALTAMTREATRAIEPELTYQRCCRALQNHPFTGAEENAFRDGFSNGFASGFDFALPAIQALGRIREGLAFPENDVQRAICKTIDDTLAHFSA